MQALHQYYLSINIPIYHYRLLQLIAANMRTATDRLSSFHKAIRLEQIERKFRHERMLMKEVEAKQAIEITIQNLKKLPGALEDQNEQTIALILTQLHNLIIQYMIVDFFLLEAHLSHLLEPVREGKLSMDCTWIDLFIVLLDAKDETIRQEASALIYYSLYQLRLAISNRPNHKDYDEQIKRVIDSLPFQLFWDYNIRVAINSLNSIEEVLQTQANHGFISYFLGIHPNFLEVIMELFQISLRINLRQYTEKVVQLSLVILYIFSSNTSFNDLPEFQILRALTKDKIIAKIYNGQFDEILFLEIRTLSQCGIGLTKEQVQFLLQNTLIQQLQHKNTEYFQMLAAVVYISQLLIPQDALQLISCALFKFSVEYERQQLNFRRWLAVIVHQSGPIFKQLLQKGIQTIIGGWEDGEFSQKFEIMMRMAYQDNEALFNLLLQICYTIYETLGFLNPIINQKLRALSNYPEWQRLIESRRQSMQKREIYFN